MSVPRRQRIAISAAIGFLAFAWAYRATGQGTPRDFAQIWYAAHAVLRGQDPYALVGPGRAFAWDFRLFYPLPAALVALPLAPLPSALACAVFAGAGAGLFGWAVMAQGYAPLLGCGSACLLGAADVAQWAPLLAASMVLPPVAFLLVCKPTIGAALFVARPSWWAVTGVVVLGGLAFLIQPGWLAAWLTAVTDHGPGSGLGRPGFIPLFAPGGILVLSALTRWRRPEARLLVALACVPQTLLLYEAAPLFLVPRTLRESAVLVVASYLAALWVLRYAGPMDYRTFVETCGRTLTLVLYLPCTLMVLRRPNEGTVPAWLEQRITAWPAMLRGRSRAEA